MSTRSPRARRVKALILDDRMDILSRNPAELSLAQQVVSTVRNILGVVKDKMIDNEDAVQLSEYCFNAYEVLDITISGQSAEELGEPVKIALEDLRRVMGEIERTLRRVASTPHTNYRKVEGYKLEIQRILDILATVTTSPVSDTAMENATSTAQDCFEGVVTDSITESAVWPSAGRTVIKPGRSFPIESILLSEDGGNVAQGLHQGDAQSFIDAIDEALMDMLDLSPLTRKQCLKLLYKMCGHYALVPKALQITAEYDRMGSALYRGGFADVWKGEHGGREVAVKVLRTYCNSDLQKVVGKFCKEVVTWRALHHPNILPLIGVTMTETRFAIISDWMENGNINEFVKENPDVERLTLLAGAAKGLIYIHSQEMIHGDLKGANILIDRAGNARLADFGLLTIISDPTNLLSSSSYTQGGTARWMSPELIAPEKFGLETSRPTEASDCYALGMVIYETIAENLPFHEHTDLAVFVKVLEGERPPREAEFTDAVWEMLKLCWSPHPSSRPSIVDILRCLEGDPQPWEPSSPETEEVDKGAESDSSEDSSGTMLDHELLYTSGTIDPLDWLSKSNSDNGYTHPYDRVSVRLEDLGNFVETSTKPFTGVEGAYSLKEYLKLLRSMDHGNGDGV